MFNQSNVKKIKEAAEEFFSKMTISVLEMDVSLLSSDQNFTENESGEAKKNVIDLKIKVEEPQILIGQGGQTLFEIQRLLRIILNKRLAPHQNDESIESEQNTFYLNLDINEYKNKKVEYLKSFVRGLADEVALTRQEKSLLPMSSYERRVIHAELSDRPDVTTESKGDGLDRHIVIKPK